MSRKYQKLLYLILLLIIIDIAFYERFGSPPSRRSSHPYYNRYCVRRFPRTTEYGYASVIRQMRWITANRSENVMKNDGPLIFHDRVASHSLSMNGCKYHCRFSTNISDYRRAALAVFTSNPPEETLPKPDDQTWALESGESPFHMPLIPWSLKQNFTLFMTTNPESQVPYAYGVFMANENPESIIPAHEQIRMLDENNTRWLPSHHAQRRKKVVALIPNLDTKNRRMAYINELANYIDVDIYGEGGGLSCWVDGDACLRELSLHYKFYLAFENANCASHITGTLFNNALRYGMLPVVMGASRDHYCAVAPPNSFIHVDDFSSPAELAEYLNWLNRDDTAYASYFAWKAYGKVVTETLIQCRLCGFVHLHLNKLASIPTNVYKFHYFTDPYRQCTVFEH